MTDDIGIHPGCTLPTRSASAKDTPHPQVDFDRSIKSADLSGCNLYEISVTFNEYDVAARERGEIGLRFESWPPAIQSMMQRMIDDFTARNANATIRAITQTVTPIACVLALHWKVKS